MLHFLFFSLTVACSHSALDLFVINVFHLFSQPFKSKSYTFCSAQIFVGILFHIVVFLCNFFQLFFCNKSTLLHFSLHFPANFHYSLKPRMSYSPALLIHTRNTRLSAFRPTSVNPKRSPTHPRTTH